MVRVPRRIAQVNYNEITRRTEWICEKCKVVFRAYKDLKAHKSEVHSY